MEVTSDGGRCWRKYESYLGYYEDGGGDDGDGSQWRIALDWSGPDYSRQMTEWRWRPDAMEEQREKATKDMDH